MTVVNTMEQATKARELTREKLLRTALEQALVNLNARMKAEVEARIARAQTDIYKLTEQKIEEIARESLNDLASALGPSLKRVREELKREQKMVQRGESDSREREFELAAQYGSILASAHQEAEKLTEKVRKDLKEVRAKTLLDLEEKAKNVHKPVSPEEEARKLLERLKGEVGDNDYLKEMEGGFKELRSYITLDPAYLLVIKGFFGDKLGGRIAGVVGGFVDKQMNALGDRAKESIDKALSRYEDKLITIE